MTVFNNSKLNTVLKELVPADMTVPKVRLEECSPSNLGWLCRNLQINNGNHPEIKQTLAKLNTLRLKILLR